MKIEKFEEHVKIVIQRLTSLNNSDFKVIRHTSPRPEIEFAIWQNDYFYIEDTFELKFELPEYLNGRAGYIDIHCKYLNGRSFRISIFEFMELKKENLIKIRSEPGDSILLLIRTRSNFNPEDFKFTLDKSSTSTLPFLENVMIKSELYRREKFIIPHFEFEKEENDLIYRIPDNYSLVPEDLIIHDGDMKLNDEMYREMFSKKIKMNYTGSSNEWSLIVFAHQRVR